jgi:hypothetical protein
VSTPPAGSCVFWDPVVGAFDAAIKATSCNYNAPLTRVTLGWEKNLGRVTLLEMATAVNTINTQFQDAANKQLIANAYNAAVYPTAGRRLLQITDPSAITTVVSYREETTAPTPAPTVLPTPPTAVPTLAPPSIIDITPRPATGLGQGQTFEFVVTFDQSVIVSTAANPTISFTYTTSAPATLTNTATYNAACRFNNYDKGQVCFEHTQTTTLASATDLYLVNGAIALPANAFIRYNNNGATGADATLTFIATTVAPRSNINNKYILVQAAKVESFAVTRPIVGSTKFQVNVTYNAEVFVSTQSTYPTITTEIKYPTGTSVTAGTYATTFTNGADAYFVSQSVTNGKSTLVFERDLQTSAAFGGAWIEGMTINVLGGGSGTGVAGRDIMGAIKTQTPTYAAGSNPYIQNANAENVGTSSGLFASTALSSSTGTITVSGLSINTGITVYKSGTTQTTAFQGDTIRVSVSFDKTVTVTGSPKITLYAYQAAAATQMSQFDLLASYAGNNGNSIYFDAITLASAAVGTTDTSKPSTSLRYLMNTANDNVMTILNSGSIPSATGTIVDTPTGETVYHFYEYQMATIKFSTTTYFNVGLSIQRVQWSGSSGQTMTFTVTYGGPVQVTVAAQLTYAEQLKGSTSTNLNKAAFLYAAITQGAPSATVNFITQSASGAYDANSLIPTTYVTGDKVWIPFSNYGTNGVSLGGGDIYHDGATTAIDVDTTFTSADLNGLGGDSTTPYTVPTASTTTLAKYTSAALTKEAATNGNANAMDIKLVVTLSAASATVPNDLANVKVQLKGINGGGVAQTSLDQLLAGPAASGGNTVYTFTLANAAYTTTFGYGLYFDGVETTNDGARVQQAAVAVQLTLSANPNEIFGAIPAQKLTNNFGIKSSPLLIALNIKEWYLAQTTVGTAKQVQVKVEWYGAVTIAANSQVAVKTKATAFANANCNDAAGTEQATLFTSGNLAQHNFNTAAAALAANNAAAVEDSATGTVITLNGNANPVIDTSYASNYPLKALLTANVKAASPGKCSNANGNAPTGALLIT